MARPKLDPGKALSASIDVRLTPGELLNVRQKAREFGTNAARYCRSLILRNVPPPAPVPPEFGAAYGELARLAANLNQLAKHVNEGQLLTDQNHLSEQLAETLSACQKLRLVLKVGRQKPSKSSINHQPAD